MRPIAILTLAAAAAAVPAAAAAAREADSRVTAAIACTSIAENEERLRCYDAAVANLTEAVETGALVSRREVVQPKSLEGVVAASGGNGYGRYWVALESGDRWQVTVRNSDALPRRGTKVKLTRSPLGSYWFHEPGYPQRRARFLGNS